MVDLLMVNHTVIIRIHMSSVIFKKMMNALNLVAWRSISDNVVTSPKAINNNVCTVPKQSNLICDSDYIDDHETR